MLFNDVKTDEGGTALRVGSHNEVARILLETEYGMKGSEVSREAIKRVEERDGEYEIEQAIGMAGDVYLVHPFLLHARGKNLGSDVEHVRFMCNPNIELKKRMRLTRSMLQKGRFNGLSFTPVEQAIVDAIRETE